MNCVILFRINDGAVEAIRHCNDDGTENGQLHEFDNMDEAVSFIHAADHPFARLIDSGQCDYQIVELVDI